MFDLRFQYLDKEGSIKPGKRGVSISADALPEVIEALLAIRAHLVHDGYLEFTGEGNPCKVHPGALPGNGLVSHHAGGRLNLIPHIKIINWM